MHLVLLLVELQWSEWRNWKEIVKSYDIWGMHSWLVLKADAALEPLSVMDYRKRCYISTLRESVSINSAVHIELINNVVKSMSLRRDNWTKIFFESTLSVVPIQFIFIRAYSIVKQRNADYSKRCKERNRKHLKMFQEKVYDRRSESCSSSGYLDYLPLEIMEMKVALVIQLITAWSIVGNTLNMNAQ